MTEGLGLNHFADGLPYAPASSKRKTATSFPPGPSIARTAAPAGLMQAPIGTESARKMIEEFDPGAAAQAAPSTDAEPVSAGMFRRVLAYSFDVAFLTALYAVIVTASFSLSGFNLGELLSERRGVQIFWPLALLYGVVYLGYFLVQETTWRRTLGKAVMGIRIRATSGFATLGRAVCFFMAALPFGVGLFWYFFDSRGRCWHDVITDSEVVLS